MGRQRVSDRQVINGMVCKIRTGISWRGLPERHGPWTSVHTRFRRYALDGEFTRALQQIQARTFTEGLLPRRGDGGGVVFALADVQAEIDVDVATDLVFRGVELLRPS